ncbi:putative metal-binding motif-containing protein [Candidatus Uhrbacteria bacterium]|nr:putative metal-binding motif-containing protein [Candidatus Uhrbacteria bacterium]
MKVMNTIAAAVVGLIVGFYLAVLVFGCAPGDVPMYSADDRQGDSTPGLDEDGDFYDLASDCNDRNAAIHPGAVEVCGDGVDQDCNGSDLVCSPQETLPPDDDVDNDGYSDDVDCDDEDPNVYPGAVETCNSLDDDCDDQMDENVTVTFYRDWDVDGYGNVADTDSRLGCAGEDHEGWSEMAGDCDDTKDSVYPGAVEQCDSIDNDCDGSIDENGTSVTTWYRDADGDTYGTTSTTTSNCSQPTGYVSRSGDCDDSRATVYPGVTETSNGIDDDCDGSIDEGFTTWYRDVDGDGYGITTDTKTATSQPSGYINKYGDCADSNATIHPGAVEVTTNGVDDDCDGTIDEGTEAKVEVNYSTKNTYQLNAQVFTAASQLGNEWYETASVTSANAVSVEFTTAEYGSLADFCGVRLNVSVGNPAYDWLCEGSAIDPSVQVDIWWKGTWYDESKLKVWVANSSSGSCSAVLLVSTASQCQSSSIK